MASYAVQVPGMACDSHDVVLKFDARQMHRETKLVSTSPLEIVTPAPQWSYGAWMTCDSAGGDGGLGAVLAVTARIEERAGCAGIGRTRAGFDDFVAEKYVSGPGAETVTLRVSLDALPGRLMFRNAGASGP